MSCSQDAAGLRPPRQTACLRSDVEKEEREGHQAAP
jgi:hypothetical protein